MRLTSIKPAHEMRVLEVVFDDGARFDPPFEYLRVLAVGGSTRPWPRPGNVALVQA